MDDVPADVDLDRGLLPGWRADGTRLPEGSAVQELLDVAEQFASERAVAYDEVDVRGRRMGVSTVFLPFAHGFTGDGRPLLFETMVFTDGVPGECVRTPDRTAALAAHEAALGRVLARAGR